MQMATSIEMENGEMIVKRVSVPIGLEELMEGLTREVIIKKPKDIYVFASEYFAHLLDLREKGPFKRVPVKRVSSVTKPIQRNNQIKESVKKSKSVDAGTNVAELLTKKITVSSRKPPSVALKDNQTKTVLERHKARKASIDNSTKSKRDQDPKNLTPRAGSDKNDGVMLRRGRSLSNNNRGRSVDEKIKTPRQRSQTGASPVAKVDRQASLKAGAKLQKPEEQGKKTVRKEQDSDKRKPTMGIVQPTIMEMSASDAGPKKEVVADIAKAGSSEENNDGQAIKSNDPKTEVEIIADIPQPECVGCALTNEGAFDMKTASNNEEKIDAEDITTKGDLTLINKNNTNELDDETIKDKTKATEIEQNQAASELIDKFGEDQDTSEERAIIKDNSENNAQVEDHNNLNSNDNNQKASAVEGNNNSTEEADIAEEHEKIVESMEPPKLKDFEHEKTETKTEIEEHSVTESSKSNDEGEDITDHNETGEIKNDKAELTTSEQKISATETDSTGLVELPTLNTFTSDKTETEIDMEKGQGSAIESSKSKVSDENDAENGAEQKEIPEIKNHKEENTTSEQTISSTETDSVGSVEPPTLNTLGPENTEREIDMEKCQDSVIESSNSKVSDENDEEENETGQKEIPEVKNDKKELITSEQNTCATETNSTRIRSQSVTELGQLNDATTDAELIQSDDTISEDDVKSKDSGQNQIEGTGLQVNAEKEIVDSKTENEHNKEEVETDNSLETITENSAEVSSVNETENEEQQSDDRGEKNIDIKGGQENGAETLIETKNVDAKQSIEEETENKIESNNVVINMKESAVNDSKLSEIINKVDDEDDENENHAKRPDTSPNNENINAGTNTIHEKQLTIIPQADDNSLIQSEAEEKLKDKTSAFGTENENIYTENEGKLAKTISSFVSREIVGQNEDRMAVAESQEHGNEISPPLTEETIDQRDASEDVAKIEEEHIHEVRSTTSEEKVDQHGSNDGVENRDEVIPSIGEEMIDQKDNGNQEHGDISGHTIDIDQKGVTENEETANEIKSSVSNNTHDDKNDIDKDVEEHDKNPPITEETTDPKDASNDVAKIEEEHVHKVHLTTSEEKVDQLTNNYGVENKNEVIPSINEETIDQKDNGNQEHGNISGHTIDIDQKGVTENEQTANEIKSSVSNNVNDDKNDMDKDVEEDDTNPLITEETSDQKNANSHVAKIEEEHVPKVRSTITEENADQHDSKDGVENRGEVISSISEETIDRKENDNQEHGNISGDVIDSDQKDVTKNGETANEMKSSVSNDANDDTDKDMEKYDKRPPIAAEITDQKDASTSVVTSVEEHGDKINLTTGEEKVDQHETKDGTENMDKVISSIGEEMIDQKDNTKEVTLNKEHGNVGDDIINVDQKNVTEHEETANEFKLSISNDTPDDKGDTDKDVEESDKPVTQDNVSDDKVENHNKLNDIDEQSQEENSVKTAVEVKTEQDEVECKENETVAENRTSDVTATKIIGNRTKLKSKESIKLANARTKSLSHDQLLKTADTKNKNKEDRQLKRVKSVDSTKMWSPKSKLPHPSKNRTIADDVSKDENGKMKRGKRSISADKGTKNDKLKQDANKSAQDKNAAGGEKTNKIADAESERDNKPPKQNIKLVDAVVKIQALWRGFQVRKHIKCGELFGYTVEPDNAVKETLKTADEIHRKKVSSAMKIQALWKGYKVRKNIRDVKNKLAELQKPTECDEMDSQRGLTDEDILNAATKIQAGVRGYMVRKKKKHQLNCITEEPSITNQLSEEQIVAALEKLEDVPKEAPGKNGRIQRSITVDEPQVLRKFVKGVSVDVGRMQPERLKYNSLEDDPDATDEQSSRLTVVEEHSDPDNLNSCDSEKHLDHVTELEEQTSKIGSEDLLTELGGNENKSTESTDHVRNPDDLVLKKEAVQNENNINDAKPEDNPVTNGAISSDIDRNQNDTVEESKEERRPLSMESLTSNDSVVTVIPNNDFGSNMVDTVYTPAYHEGTEENTKIQEMSEEEETANSKSDDVHKFSIERLRQEIKEASKTDEAKEESNEDNTNKTEEVTSEANSDIIDAKCEVIGDNEILSTKELDTHDNGVEKLASKPEQNQNEKEITSEVNTVEAKYVTNSQTIDEAGALQDETADGNITQSVLTPTQIQECKESILHKDGLEDIGDSNTLSVSEAGTEQKVIDNNHEEKSTNEQINSSSNTSEDRSEEKILTVEKDETVLNDGSELEKKPNETNDHLGTIEDANQSTETCDSSKNPEKENINIEGNDSEKAVSTIPEIENDNKTNDSEQAAAKNGLDHNVVNDNVKNDKSSVNEEEAPTANETKEEPHNGEVDESDNLSHSIEETKHDKAQMIESEPTNLNLEHEVKNDKPGKSIEDRHLDKLPESISEKSPKESNKDANANEIAPVSEPVIKGKILSNMDKLVQNSENEDAESEDIFDKVNDNDKRKVSFTIGDEEIVLSQPSKDDATSNTSEEKCSKFDLAALRKEIEETSSDSFSFGNKSQDIETTSTQSPDLQEDNNRLDLAKLKTEIAEAHERFNASLEKSESTENKQPKSVDIIDADESTVNRNQLSDSENNKVDLTKLGAEVQNHVKEYKVGQNLQIPIPEDAAATKIQSLYRGHRVRRDLRMPASTYLGAPSEDLSDSNSTAEVPQDLNTIEFNNNDAVKKNENDDRMKTENDANSAQPTNKIDDEKDIEVSRVLLAAERELAAKSKDVDLKPKSATQIKTPSPLLIVADHNGHKLGTTTINLVHTSEFHDTITVPLPSPPQNEIAESRTPSRGSPLRLVNTGELHDTVLPVSVQLNQAPPAGAEILTSPTSTATNDGVHVVDAQQDDAQASVKDASTCAAQPDDEAQTSLDSDMESAKRNNASIPTKAKNMEAEAATKIQAGFRGYQVRKQLKNKTGASGDISNQRRSARRKSSGRVTEAGRITQAKPKGPSDLEEKSAVKIQAGIRGFLVRRRQKKQKLSKDSS